MSLSGHGELPLDASPLVRVHQENGTRIDFVRQQDGSYESAAYVLADLEAVSDGFELRRRSSQQVFGFDREGRLRSVSDRNGIAITLGYDGDRVALVSGRTGALSVAWDGDRVASVSDQSGRTVTYGYSADGNLVEVVSPGGGVTRYGYGDGHRLVTMTDARGATTTQDYDATGRVVRQTDPVGGVLTFEYASGQTRVVAPDGTVTVERYADGRLESVTSASGTGAEATTSFTYDPTNQVRTVTDALGQQWVYAYDARGNRVSETDPLGGTTTAVYDRDDLVEVVNPAGERTMFVYDDRGNLVERVEPDGAATTMAVDDDGAVVSVTGPLGDIVEHKYDARGRLVRTVEADGAVTTAEYDDVGNITTVETPAPAGSGLAVARTLYGYDAEGRVTSARDAVGGTALVEYEAGGEPARVVAADGRVTSFEYDDAGRLISTTDAAGATTRLTYGAGGRVTSVVEPDGATTAYEYDEGGNRTAEVDPLGRTWRYEHDALNRVVQELAPSGATTSYGYDPVGRPISTVHPGTGTTSTEYDAVGRVSAATDADGRSVSLEYDVVGRLTAAERGDGSVLRWCYDAAGRQTGYTDGAGTVVSYAYDAAGRTTARNAPGEGESIYRYDLAGNLTEWVGSDGGVTSYRYDGLSRLTVVAYPDDAGVEFGYDAVGRRTSMSDGSGRTTYEYDAAGRLAAVVGPGSTVGYGWDPRGQLTRLTYPDGSRLDRSYDAAGQLEHVTDGTGGRFAFGWSPDGRLDEVLYPNGIRTDLTHSDDGQVSRVTAVADDGAALLDLAYDYTDAGLLSTMATARPSASSAWAYDWDERARLSAVAGAADGRVQYSHADQVSLLPDGATLSYDEAGRLSRAARGAETTDFAFDLRGNRVSEMAAGAERTFTYDGADRLLGVDSGTDTWTYAYSGDGLRSRVVHVDETGAEDARDMVWDVAASVPGLLSDGELMYVYGVGSAPLAQRGADGATLYLHGDALGSIRTVTDEAGEVVAGSDYEPYGTPVEVSGLVPVAEVTAFGFAGEYTDPTGLLYLRARFYDPATAQFLSIDPLRDRTLSLYGYTAGNPLQFVDPLGLDWLQTLGDVSAGFGDTVTFGGTAAIRDLLDFQWGYGSSVNYDSGAYTGGAIAGTVTTVVMPTGGLRRAHAAATAAGGGTAAVGALREGDHVAGALHTVGAIPGVGTAVSRWGRGYAVRSAAPGALVRTGTWWSQLGKGSSFAGTTAGLASIGPWTSYHLYYLCASERR